MPKFPLNRISAEPASEEFGARRQVEVYCQSLVDVGAAQWRVNEAGATELHMKSGEVYLLGEWGVTRLK